MSDAALFEDSIVSVRRGTHVRTYAGEAVVWSPGRPPLLLDPVGAVVLQLLNGEATVGDLAIEVSEEVGIPRSIALNQFRRVLSSLAEGGALSGPHSVPPPDVPGEVFHGPYNP